jgi:hypothetical protein
MEAYFSGLQNVHISFLLPGQLLIIDSENMNVLSIGKEASAR